MIKSKKPFFYFEKLEWWEWLIIITYSVLTFVVFYWNTELKNSFLLGYSFSTPLILMLFFYKSLRKVNFYVFWFIIAILHLWFYVEYKSFSGFKMIRGSSITYFVFTVIFVIYYQLCRYLSFIVIKREFLFPSQHSKYDTELKRGTYTSFEYMVFVTFFSIFVLIPILI